MSKEERDMEEEQGPEYSGVDPVENEYHLDPKDQELADRMQLAAQEVVAANELMRGKSMEAIARKLVVPVDRVKKMFARPGMREYLKEIQKKVEQTTILSASTVQEAFNKEFTEGFKTLRQIHRSGKAADRDRIRAIEVLGKYQNLVAPAAKQAENGKSEKKIHLGSREMDNMQAALREMGNRSLRKPYKPRGTTRYTNDDGKPRDCGG